MVYYGLLLWFIVVESFWTASPASTDLSMSKDISMEPRGLIKGSPLPSQFQDSGGSPQLWFVTCKACVFISSSDASRNGNGGIILGIILEWTDLVARKEITSRGAQLSMAPLCYTTLHNFTQLGCLCDELSMSEASCIPLWRLPLHQSGVDIKLRAAIATHAVGIAVVVAILSRRTRWHIHQKEIHLAGSDGSDVFSS